MSADNPFVIDVAAAIVIALIVLIVSPGAAVDAILVLVLLVICGVGALVARRRARSVPSRRPRPGSARATSTRRR